MKNFPNGIKALAECQRHCSQSYPQNMCKMTGLCGNTWSNIMTQIGKPGISVPKGVLPCFCAGSIYRFESRYLARVKVLAHNLIHKRCAKHPRSKKYHGTIFEGRIFYPLFSDARFLRSKKFSFGIKDLS
jgi:hypothetical protein